MNPAADFLLEPGDDAVVVAESLGTLAPLEMRDMTSAAPEDRRGGAQRLAVRTGRRGRPTAPESRCNIALGRS